MTDWDQTFMKMAELMAEHATCNRLKVGAVVVLDRRVIGTGYNGTPKGHYHCEEVNASLDYTKQEDRDMHHSFSSKWEIHAEMNAIIDMAKREQPPQGSTIYITTAPCNDCAKLIIASGVKRVVYKDGYDRETSKYRDDMLEEEIRYGALSGIDILKISGIEVEKI